MAWDGHWTIGSDREAGQASLMMLGLVGALLVATAVLFGFGNALGAKGRHQRAADLAAISAAQVMRDLYPSLFEPPFIEPDVPNPRHLEEAEFRELARGCRGEGGGRERRPPERQRRGPRRNRLRAHARDGPGARRSSRTHRPRPRRHRAHTGP